MSDATAVSFRTYEERLDADPEWALLEGSRHFEETSAVHQTLRRICTKLDDLGIDYAVVGGMALFQHGFRRFTEDVDVLVSREGLKRIHHELEGRGYLSLFTGSKNLRDTETRVRIEFLLQGDYPGDGKEKPVAFPAPAECSVEINGVRCLELSKLIELKIASGMTSDRVKDLGDVQELIKLLHLPAEYSATLNPYVQGKFDELWQDAMGTPKRYVRIWRNRFLTLDAESLKDMEQSLRNAADQLQAMLDDGIVLDPDGGTADDYAYLVTTDAEVARRYDMHEESEFFDLDEEDPEVTPD